MQQYIAGGSILGTVVTVIVALVVWHWFESGENYGVGISMAWQDVKVAVSCRSLTTPVTFITRKYEDYQLDKPLFASPSWKHFICPIYSESTIRTKAYRESTKEPSFNAMPAPAQQRLLQWIGNKYKERNPRIRHWIWYPAS